MCDWERWIIAPPISLKYKLWLKKYATIMYHSKNRRGKLPSHPKIQSDRLFRRQNYISLSSIRPVLAGMIKDSCLSPLHNNKIIYDIPVKPKDSLNGGRYDVADAISISWFLPQEWSNHRYILIYPQIFYDIKYF